MFKKFLSEESSRKNKFRHSFLMFLALIAGVSISGQSSSALEVEKSHHEKVGQEFQNLSKNDQKFLDDLEHRTFNWFWDNTNPKNGLIPDRTPVPGGAASIASVGFGLTSYGVGVQRGYITRRQAVKRTLRTLRFLEKLPQNDKRTGAAGYHGFYYHFLDPKTGLRVADWSELSSVDTALLMGGVLFAQSYYDRATPQEREIRTIASRLYRRVDWQWMRNKGQWLSMGWFPPNKFIPVDWKGYNEGLIIYLLALASPTHPLPQQVWLDWTKTYNNQWGKFQGHTFLNFAPLFGHQYSEAWIDFRGIRDSFNRKHETDYFKNSREAVYAQREYAKANPGKWNDYSQNIWGLTASDGPGDVTKEQDGLKRHFLAYSARGVGRDYINDDGTIAPTAAGGSVAIAPEIALPALKEMKRRYGGKIYNHYGFVDAFNPTFKTHDGFWADGQQIGIDQGPILLMIENYRSQFVWNVMKKNPVIRTALTKAGFTGGWIEKK